MDIYTPQALFAGHAIRDTSVYEFRKMQSRVLLYVEDEDAAFLLFETALRAANIQVELHRAADGEQAMTLLQGKRAGMRLRPDLVILDLNLPGRNGFEVLAEIKGDDNLQSITVVMFTSSSLASDRQRSLALGAEDYITKPFTYDGFVEAVKVACSHLAAA